MTDNPWDQPEALAWMDDVRKNLVPMLDSSAVSVTIAPALDSYDVKIAVELGMTILMNKPLLVVIEQGRPVPPKLRMVADDIFYVDWSSKDSQRELAGVHRRFRAEVRR